MMTDPSCGRPRLSQPSSPCEPAAERAGENGASPQEIACVKGRLAAEDLSILGLRFKSDSWSPTRVRDLPALVRRPLRAIELEDEARAPASSRRMPC